VSRLLRRRRLLRSQGLFFNVVLDILDVVLLLSLLLLLLPLLLLVSIGPTDF